MSEVIATGRTVDEAIENGCQELGLSRDEVSVEILEMPARKLFKTIPAKVKVTADQPEAEESKKPTPQKQPEKQEKIAEKPQPVKNQEKPKSAPAAQAAKQQERPVSTEVLPPEPEEKINLEENAPAAKAANYLMSIFKAMDAEQVQVNAFKQGDATLFRVEGMNFNEVLEVKGETIQALSYLTDRSVNKGVDKHSDEYVRVRLDIAGYRNRRESELVLLARRVGEEVSRTHRSKTLAPMNSYERLIVHTAISEMEGLTSESRGADLERRVVVRSTAADATEGEDWKPAGQKRSGGNSRGGNQGRGSRPPRVGDRDRGPRNNNRDRNSRDRGGNRSRDQRSNVPGREYADKKRDPNAAPVVPERRENIRDGEDLPLYGKIEL